MNNRKLLLGDEAFALGAIDAGLSGAYAYPGTPSTEIMEFVQNNALARERGIHCHWSSNEKTAYEEALGMSFCGKRATVSMKHVGVNVAADPFINSAMTGVGGALILAAADDPSMHSSQNEQDSRFYAAFAFVPVLEPCNQQEAYDMAAYGFEMSEKFEIPVMVRFVTRLSHSRGDVTPVSEPAPQKDLAFPDSSKASRWVLMPGNSRRRYPQVLDTYARLEDESCRSPYNRLCGGTDSRVGIIVSGIAWNYLNELYPQGIPYPTLKIGQYPMPKKLVEQLAGRCDSLLVVEEGQPFIETDIRGVLPTPLPVYGRLSGHLPRTGELTPDAIREGLHKIVPDDSATLPTDTFAPSAIVRPRPPQLCQGCGHRDVFTALNAVLAEYDNPRVFGDIGCYTLGWLSPFNAIDTVVDMGASITMAKGAADAGQHPSLAIIGDSTFTHSGMTGLLDAINENTNCTVIISDNLTTAMTGGQDSQGTGKLESICIGLGAHPDHVRTIDSLPKNHEEIKRVFREEIDYPGLSVVISRRECIQTARRHNAAAAKKN